jgi:hypothetical protein
MNIKNSNKKDLDTTGSRAIDKLEYMMYKNDIPASQINKVIQEYKISKKEVKKIAENAIMYHIENALKNEKFADYLNALIEKEDRVKLLEDGIPQNYFNIARREKDRIEVLKRYL